jgi:uncharacterized membrane protein
MRVPAKVRGNAVGMLSDRSFETLAENVGRAIDLAGVAVVAGGILLATVLLLPAIRARKASDALFRCYRQRVGKSILLGLEFLVAADIIRTVAVSPSFRGVGVLAIIVLVRTFLSFTLELELEHKWPWQRRSAG